MPAPKKILVVGDFVEDVYTHVQTTRNCPEAPAPVYDVVRHDRFLGCAGNVVLNLLALVGKGAVCALGPMSETVEKVLNDRLGYLSVYPSIDDGGIIKQRIVCDGKIVCRVDNTRWAPNTGGISWLKEEAESMSAIVVSDYGFGGVSDEIIDVVMRSGLPVFVDSKRKDMSVFRGATVFKLNEFEWAEQNSACARGPDVFVESLCQFCVVTRGGRGCDVRVRAVAPRGGYSTDTISFPAHAVAPVVDVTGCGDTFLAALVYSMICRETDVFFGCRFANYVASRAVSTWGPFVPDEAAVRGMIDMFFDDKEQGK